MSASNKRAAALKYEPETNSYAPIIVASGLGYVAEQIVAIAEEHNVPVYHDDSLAALLSQLDAGTQIPEELYQIIAEIYVYFLNFSMKK